MLEIEYLARIYTVEIEATHNSDNKATIFEIRSHNSIWVHHASKTILISKKVQPHFSIIQIHSLLSNTRG